MWDVTVIAWMLHTDNRALATRISPLRLPDYQGGYEAQHGERFIGYVYHLRRDLILPDFVEKLTK